MASTAIAAPEFRQRVADLCLGGVGPGLPRRRRDRHILLKAAAMELGQGREYAEGVVNRVLESWLEALGPAVRMDHVSLRRYLIDEGYVVRDNAGSVYRVRAAGAQPEEFESEVESLDALEIVRRALTDRERRRDGH
ncbi:MAG: DUF2087 domain-containing protein [Candidatus Eisenbacteria bacterium]|nr:DUF2087 domain-containing protein [Candidatus Eisenbacteria bacterium]